MRIINLTPHTINFMVDGKELAIPSSGIARCRDIRRKLCVLKAGDLSIPIEKLEFGPIDGLPDPAPDSIYIVSTLVAQAAKRMDVLSPCQVVRDRSGLVMGCSSLASFV